MKYKTWLVIQYKNFRNGWRCNEFITVFNDKIIQNILQDVPQKHHSNIILKLYDELKNSVNYEACVEFNANPVTTITEVTQKLRNIMITEKNMKCQTQLIPYEKNLTLSRLRILSISTKVFKKVLKNIMSCQQVCKLICFYNK